MSNPGAKEQLLVAVAHDIKNELGWLTGQLERIQLAHPHLAELSQACESAQTLSQKLVQYLQVYAATHSSLQANADSCELHAFLKEVAQSSGTKAALLRLEAAPTFWVLDEHLVTLALSAALDNAYKFAKSAVWLGAEKQGTDLVLFVEDDGPGLATGATPGGTGLGTAVAQMVAAAHRGATADADVRLLTRPAGGCRFELRLPP